MDFTGKTAFVTGAGGGMGYHIARDLVAAGCRVTALDIKPNPGDFAAGPGSINYIQGDLCETATIDRADSSGDSCSESIAS